MKNFTQITLVLALVYLAGCAAGHHGNTSVNCVGVSEALSMEPDRDPVSVCGVLKYAFEDKNLYESENAAREQSSRKCISIGKASDLEDDLAHYDGRWVRVQGQVVRPFCPDGVICPAACSDIGIFVSVIQGE